MEDDPINQSVHLTNKRQAKNHLSTSAEKKRKKRRSSFMNIVGRKSGDFLRPARKLCESIPKDLPEEERLEKLLLGALDYALLNVQHQNPDLDSGQIKDDIRSEVLVCLANQKEDGTFRKACESDSMPGATNIKSEKLVKAYERRIEKLEGESDTWVRLETEARHDRDHAHRLLNEGKESPLTDPPDTLSETQKKLLRDVRMDFDRMETDLMTAEDRITTYIARLSACASGLQRRHNNVRTQLSHSLNKFHETIRNNQSDPRDTILALLEDDLLESADLTNTDEGSTGTCST